MKTKAFQLRQIGAATDALLQHLRDLEVIRQLPGGGEMFADALRTVRAETLGMIGALMARAETQGATVICPLGVQAYPDDYLIRRASQSLSRELRPGHQSASPTQPRVNRSSRKAAKGGRKSQ